MANAATDQNFADEVENYEGVALVDFWAPWCGPCQMVGPIIKELAEEMKDSAKILKLNVDENPTIAQKYGVMSIPTMVIYKNGKEVDRIVGVQPKDALKAKIESHK